MIQIIHMIQIMFVIILLTILIYSLLKTNLGNIIFCNYKINKKILKKYINIFSKYELEFKTNNKNIKFNQDNILKYYIHKILKFTDNEKNLLINHINHINNVAPKFITNSDWNFIKLSTDIEAGMPFTLNKYIFFSDRFLNRLNIKHLFLENCDTIIHEKIHIFQRLYPQIFKNFYINNLGVIYNKNIILTKDWKNKNLKNPDGLDINWIYPYKNKFYLPMLLFNNSTKGVNQIVIELKNIGKKFITTKLSQDIYNFPPFKIYPKFISLYHPNEISAYIIPKIILKSHKFNKNIMTKFNKFINTDLINLSILI